MDRDRLLAGPNDSVATFRLRTFRTLALTRAEDGEVLVGAGKSLALLTYLALTPGRRASREVLIDLLWADQEPERARNALRQALWGLRRVLGDGFLAGAEELVLDGALSVDRDEFLARVERGELTEALESYTGAFMPSFALPGGAAFEQWADLERRRLQSAFLRTTELAVRRMLKQARAKDAQQLARRARDEAPHTESAWRLLLETIIAGSDFVAASVEADALETWAQRESSTLESSTRAMLRAARRVAVHDAEDEHSPNREFVAELTGREQPFSQIVDAWERARAGPAQAIHLMAVAGLGKSRLLREATARLRAGGAEVVQLRGAPADRDIPYAFAGDLAMAVASRAGAAGVSPASARTLIALNPALSSRLPGEPDASVGEDALHRRLHALADLVQAVADEQPIVLAIDDVHWLDGASFRMLEGLIGRVGISPVLFLTAGRPERVLSSDVSSIIALEPLTSMQVSALLSSIARLPDDDAWSSTFASGMQRATRGSPLLVMETLRLAMDQDVLALESGVWACRDERGLHALLRSGEAIRHRVHALSLDDRRPLSLLAIAGSALDADAMARALRTPPDSVRGALAVLERVGMVVRQGEAWSPSHDEIADAAREALTADEVRAMSLAVGVLLTEGTAHDVLSTRRGMQHLRHAGAREAMLTAFRRYAQRARERGDRRSNLALALDVLGDEATATERTDLLRALPPLTRLGLWSATRRAAAFSVVVLAMLLTAFVWQSRADRTDIQRLVYVDSAGAARVVRVSPRDWTRETSALVATPVSSDWVTAASDFPEIPPSFSPDGRSVAWTRSSGDSTTLDIWIRTPAGERRLTSHLRDDVVTGWLPDGSALVGLTNRYSPREHGNYDVVIYDTASGVPTQITRGIDHDGVPAVSPDGTRIAFSRETPRMPSRVCVVAIDGADEPSCRLVGNDGLAGLVGWLTPTELLLVADRANARPLVKLDWSRDVTTDVIGGFVRSARLSRDRRWVMVRALIPGMQGVHDWVTSVDDPARARVIDGADTRGLLQAWWEGAAASSMLVASIAFTDTARTILPGIGRRLAIRALTATGTPVPLHVAVRWRSSDTSVATVSDSGDVRAVASGTVTVSATAGGWRSVSRTLTVRAEPAVTVLTEFWHKDWRARWRTFGDPAPDVVAGPGGVRGFANRGDETYASFALSREGYDARDGLGIEVQVSTPFSSSSAQRVRTELLVGADTAALRLAHPGGPSPLRGVVACGTNFSESTGAFGGQRLDVTGGISTWVPLGEVAETARRGDWWTIRLQLLPDGRCGVAVNGRVLWISPDPVSINGPVFVRLGDVSLRDVLLHGPLTVWRGVRTDMDWR